MGKGPLFFNASEVEKTKIDLVVEAILEVSRDVSNWFLELLKRAGVVAIVAGLASSQSDDLSNVTGINLIYWASWTALTFWALYPTLRAVYEARRELNMRHPWMLAAFIIGGLVAFGTAIQVLTIINQVIAALLTATPTHP
ncbi:hypothetical protein [uncultured Brevundimonas sp.]|uniref:hypothetical protein n=1 Tax=uncultured Brevundimonas sp. TaxID=213418 RepID=UPI0025EFABA5|nr:hypothetical protein [uncultured Brevundimonas sp.]